MNDDVLLVAKNKFESMWDGKPFKIAKGKDRQVKRGLAEHFINKFPNAGLEIKELEEEETKPRQTKKKEKEETAFEELS